MKVTKIRDSLSWRSWCYFEAQVWKKDSNIAPFFLGLSFFYFYLAFLFFLFFIGTMLYEWWSSHFYLFTTQWLQLDTRTKYDSIWTPPAVYRDGQWIKSDMYEIICMVALPQIRCQLHDHARQYDNDEHAMINGTVESCMAIYLGMAMEMP